MDSLLETVMLVAEVGSLPLFLLKDPKHLHTSSETKSLTCFCQFQELKANPDRSAQGTVIESCLDKTKGVLATLLVQNGTLKKGDVVLCGEAYGKVSVTSNFYFPWQFFL